MDRHLYEREAVGKEQKKCRPTEGKASIKAERDVATNEGMAAATGSWKKDSSEEPERARHRGHLDVTLPASSTGRECTSVVLSQQVCGDLLHQPQETNTRTFKVWK